VSPSPGQVTLAPPACITPDATGRARTGNGSHASRGPNPPNAQGLQHDVAPDGRFLIATVLDNSATAPITLLTNWNPEAKK
jgi:hypothetical protein